MTRCRWTHLVPLLASLWAGSAEAQTDADRAAAQTLFDEGQRLKDDGDLEQACDKFRASQKLDPAVGTQLNLADCYEKLGKTASAWINYTEVAQDKAAGKKRASIGKKRAEALLPKLTKLLIEVPSPVDGMTLKRGDVEVPAETWGTAVPVDPGSYQLSVKARGWLPWRRKVEVAGEGETITVTVPELIEDDEPDEPDEVSREPVDKKVAPEGTSGQTVAGGVVLGLGAAGVAVGAVLAGLAHSKAAKSKDHCLPEDTNQCDADGVAMRDQAQTMQLGYVVSFAVGGAALVAGMVTLLTAPSSPGSKDESAAARLVVVPSASPVGAGIAVHAKF